MAITRTQEATAANSGSQTTLTVTITAATAGRLLVSCVASDKAAGTYTPPSGFTIIKDQSSADVSGAIAYKVAAGGETAITWTQSTAAIQGISAWCGEYSGTSASPLDVSAETENDGTGVASRSSGTTAGTALANEFAIAMMAVDSQANATDGRAWTNSFVETEWVNNGINGNPGLSVAEKAIAGASTAVETTFSTTEAGDQMYACVAVFKPADVVEHIVLTVTPTLPAASIEAGILTHIVLTVTPSLPVATIQGTGQVTHIVFTLTPSLPAAVLKEAITHIVLTVSPSLPVAQVTDANEVIITSVTTIRKKTMIGPTRPHEHIW